LAIERTPHVIEVSMNLQSIKEKIRQNQYLYSQHAEIERKADGITFC
jgi:hypothetical protein